MYGSFTRSGLRQVSVHQEPPRTDVSRTWATTTVAIHVSSYSRTRDNVRSVSPRLRELVLSAQWSAAHFIWKSTSGEGMKRHRIQVAWSQVWSFHSQWLFGEPCHLLVPISFSYSTWPLPTLPKPIPGLRTIVLCLIGQPTRVIWTS